jgi:uncharacterized heparinase superfamily protein
MNEGKRKNYMNARFRKKIFDQYYKSFFFAKRFSSPQTIELKSIINDCWPTPTTMVEMLRSGLIATEQGGVSLNEMADFMQPSTYDACLYSLHSFECLRALKAVGDSSCRRIARQLISQWISAQLPKWRLYWLKPSWHGDIMAVRLSNWIMFYDFFGQSADDDFFIPFVKSLQIQYDILLRSFYYLPVIERIKAIKGLLVTFLSINYHPSQATLTHLLHHLQKTLSLAVLDDGGIINHHCMTLVGVLRDLLDIRMALRMAKVTEPSIIGEIVGRIVPVIRVLRHGDGLLSSFEGQATPWQIAYGTYLNSERLVDMALSLTDTKSPNTKHQRKMGYHRLQHKSTMLVLNTQPNLHSYTQAYGGKGLNIFQFELSQKRQRVIALCDCIVQTTSGHFTSLVLHKEREPVVEFTHEKDHYLFSCKTDFVTTVEKNPHDGIYCLYKREIYLSPEGEIRGNDTITLGESGLVAVRFVLGKSCEMKSINAEKGIITIESSEHHARSHKKVSTYQCLSKGYEKIIHEEHQGMGVLIFVHSIGENSPHAFQWGFKKIT